MVCFSVLGWSCVLCWCRPSEFEISLVVLHHHCRCVHGPRPLLALFVSDFARSLGASQSRLSKSRSRSQRLSESERMPSAEGSIFFQFKLILTNHDSSRSVSLSLGGQNESRVVEGNVVGTREILSERRIGKSKGKNLRVTRRGFGKIAGRCS